MLVTKPCLSRLEQYRSTWPASHLAGCRNPLRGSTRRPSQEAALRISVRSCSCLHRKMATRSYSLKWAAFASKWIKPNLHRPRLPRRGFLQEQRDHEAQDQSAQRGGNGTGPSVSYWTGHPNTNRPPCSVVRQYSTAASICRRSLASVCSIESGPEPWTEMSVSGSMP